MRRQHGRHVEVAGRVALEGLPPNRRHQKWGHCQRGRGAWVDVAAKFALRDAALDDPRDDGQHPANDVAIVEASQLGKVPGLADDLFPVSTPETD